MKTTIKQLLQNKLIEDGMLETGIRGVHLFKVSEALHCAPAVYQPAIIVILNGTKEAILNGDSFKYDNQTYMCCTMNMPVEAGTPEASNEEPLLGVYITLDTKIMTELAIEIERNMRTSIQPSSSRQPKGIALSKWDEDFSDALLRLLQLNEDPSALPILSEGRLRELYYAVLKGEAGESVVQAFGIRNKISRAISYLSSHLDRNITIDELASYAGMSKSVFHQKFKEVTTMTPIQFVKTMRLNNAALKLASGMNVNETAMSVGYMSFSQFSREFKRMFGQSPKQWSTSRQFSTESIRQTASFFDQLQQSYS